MSRASACGFRALLVTAAASFGSLILVTAAFAAPAVVAVTPQPSAIVSAPGWPAVIESGMPVISALVTDAATPVSGHFVVDGVVRPAVADVSGLSFSYKPPTSGRLQDGHHTVSFNGTDAVGATVSHTWTFEVQQVPYFDSSQPASGAVVGTRRPAVSAIVYDNSLASTYTAMIDGVRLNWVNSSGYEATWGGYYGIHGTQATDLSNGIHTAYVRITDPGGHTVERTWTFVVFGEITLDTRGISEGQVYDTGRPPLYFRAWSRYSQPYLNVYIDGASAFYDITGGYYSDGNRTLDMTITPKSNYPLADGPHVVAATAWGSPAGLSVSKTFNIEVQMPPSAYHLRPSGDTVATSSTPLLVARATENSTGTVQFAFSVDGVPVVASAPRKIAMGRWEATAQVVSPLSANSTHTATVVTTDAKGNAASRSWQFFVASGERMSHYDAGTCVSCHGNPYYPHQARGGDAITYLNQYACNTCHTAFPDHATYGWYTRPMVAAQLDDPSTYLPSPWSNSTCSCHSSGHPYYANEANCRNCHDRINTINEQGEPPLGRGETIALESETPRHAVDGDHTACTRCHQLDLTFEHAGRTQTDGSPIGCQTCHASTDPSVLGAIAGGNSSCSACHVGFDHAAQHVSPTTSSCFGAGCHPASKSLVDVHALYVGPGSERSQFIDSCALCHENPSVDTTAAAAMSCTPSCHPGFTHSQYSASHASGAVSFRCKECHGTDLASVHLAGPADWSRCDVCHAQQDNWAKTGDCVSCHDGSARHLTLHDNAAPQDFCEGCHADSLIEEHVVRRSMGCSTCHGESFALASADGVDGGPGVTEGPIAQDDPRRRTKSPALTTAPGAQPPTDGHAEPGFSAADATVVFGSGTACTVCHTAPHGPRTDCATCHGTTLTTDGSEPTSTPRPEYTTWDASGANAAVPTPHKGFATATEKCAVCHAVHKASISGEMLLRGTVKGSCVYCHVSTAVGGIVLYGGEREAYLHDEFSVSHNQTSESACGDCHSVHGANTLSGANTTKILWDWSAPSVEGSYAAEALEVWPDPATVATDAAQQTAWCTGCHPFYIRSYNTTFTGQSYDHWVDYSWEPTQTKSHIMTDLAGGFANPAATDAFGKDVAFSSSEYCRSCHDAGSTDQGAGVHLDSFPHYTRDYFRFMTVGSSMEASGQTNTSGRSIDGACLKCHRDTDTSGVGYDF